MDLRNSVEILCGSQRTLKASLERFSSVEDWSPSDRRALLDVLTEFLISPEYTIQVGRVCRSFILELVHRAATITGESGRTKNYLQYQKFAVALSHLVAFCPDTRRFCSEYFTDKSLILHNPVFDEQPKRKRRKSAKKTAPCDVAMETCHLVAALYRIVTHVPAVCAVWDLSSILKLFIHDDVTVRWYALETICHVTNSADSQRRALFSKYLPHDKCNQLMVQEHFSLMNPALPISYGGPTSSTNMGAYPALGAITSSRLVTSDLCDHVVDVCGVLLERLDGAQVTEIDDTESLVVVPSCERNLRTLALAVATNKPVLLQGTVGCGKTALVGHLAHVTGRLVSKHMLKVQLGDQSDSKHLIGTYQCTNIPGEFVWQPGPLTRSMLEGLWLLLEDIDHASMDVISVLLAVMETGELSVPGQGRPIRARNGFQLFATQRVHDGTDGWYRDQSGHSTLLDKYWTTVHVESLSGPELKQVIVHHHAMLAPIVDRLLEVYFLVSSGRHDVTDEGGVMTSSDFEAGVFAAREGRLTSTRDLMKWCKRIATHDVTVTAVSVDRIYKEALDCFCWSVLDRARRWAITLAIGAILNENEAKGEYYFRNYRPEMEETGWKFRIGRECLEIKQEDATTIYRDVRENFAFTRPALCLLEQISVCVRHEEALLLVGETGNGKTSTIQFLARKLGRRLHVINMNQQSDSTDLLGGYKPMELKYAVHPIREKFEILFCQCYSRKQNLAYLGHLQELFSKRRWSDLVKLMEHPTKMAVTKYHQDSDLLSQWRDVLADLQQLKVQVMHAESAVAFSFIEIIFEQHVDEDRNYKAMIKAKCCFIQKEVIIFRSTTKEILFRLQGTLVRAMRTGDWVLLDEINLASPETLECISGLLESTSGSIVLVERGDRGPVVRHPDFRLFACMNPATDVGKKDLPSGIRNRFTEFFVDDLEKEDDLRVLVNEYLRGLSVSSSQVDGIIKFYRRIRAEAQSKLVDGTGHKPHYSLRTLCRALRQCAENRYNNTARSLYEGFCFSFLTQLDRVSHPVVERLIAETILNKSSLKALLKQPLVMPQDGQKYRQFQGYWLRQGTQEPVTSEKYVMTPSVRLNLRDLVRVVATGCQPVLIQGETSVGKTSLIRHLAEESGNVCVRINNHEHTDLQEYVGCYAADDKGRLVFKEGVLVDAMRKGYWIILDELNLAPTDVLEALNRLLDDNRELFIPETQQTVRAHAQFMLFATQNPPGQYGGRKVLSRAFRNRFVELHFDELPHSELELILHQRCEMPMSYCQRLVAVMADLQTIRQQSGVFAGKHGFITLRDLFRWAERYTKAVDKGALRGTTFYDWDQDIADNGYMLLAGRVRRQEEADVIANVINKHFKRRVDVKKLFTSKDHSDVMGKSIGGFEQIVWTSDMSRLALLVEEALKFQEPVLLVGETGCGKTTICQLFAEVMKCQLHSVSCHLHTESADFLGGLRPVRHRQSDDDTRLFEWCDGPLVLAMRGGDMLMVDEISLADDSVLERLNSVLEPERCLLLAEKGGGDGAHNEVEEVRATEKFRIIATMNPGGDYGKKELSPALRNRFTEIWCPQSRQRSDLIDIIEHNLKSGLHFTNQQDGTTGIGKAAMDFVEWMTNNQFGKSIVVSIRDLLSWVHFINATASTIRDSTPDTRTTSTLGDTCTANRLEPEVAYVHGACLVFVDGLSDVMYPGLRAACLRYLEEQVLSLTGVQVQVTTGGSTVTVINQHDKFGIRPFFIDKGPELATMSSEYAMGATTTAANLRRLLRGLQLQRPILLEGSPGVGKTSLVAALAKAAGHQLIRINLSEQTDISDLFGADLPVEGAQGGTFAWRDGPFLKALKAGHWIVLDELNLASQSVLEGLNACLDHRGEIFVPELALTFTIDKHHTKLFACQNPLCEGGGRKGLPKSFLNRFTQVYVDPLSHQDFLFITKSIYPTLEAAMLDSMITFNTKMHQETMVDRSWGLRGGPWEFNLRDVFRWCQLLVKYQDEGSYEPSEYVSLIYQDRMRTDSDKAKARELYTSLVGQPYPQRHIPVLISSVAAQVGRSVLYRRPDTDRAAQNKNDDGCSKLFLLGRCLEPLQSLMKCMEMNWMAILVGSSSSGKSSLVAMAAGLSNRRLRTLAMNSDMDTTELLGGFEQADVGRHVGKVINDVTSVLTSAIRRCLATDRRQVAARLMTELYQLNNGNRKDGDECRDEKYWLSWRLDVCLESLRSLGDVGNQSLVNSSELATLVSEVTTLRGKVSIEQSCAGGQFEWVDSMLVDALREGEWLLIDNVNFCSPSVLDRLNAVLEPEGQLTLNERGSDTSGRVPTITPHPDFRLILAMDPKHGELSRAMRNRGVEIYVMGEEEGHLYSDHDLTRLLHATGLVAPPIIQCMLDIRHRLLDCHVTCSVVDLVRASTACMERLERNADVITAVSEACTEVLVKQQRNSTVRKEVEEIVRERLQLPICSIDLDLSPDVWWHTLPSVGDYVTNSCLARVRHVTKPLALVLQEMTSLNRNPARTTATSQQADTALNSKLRTAVDVVSELTSYHDLSLLSGWLASMTSRYGDQSASRIVGELTKRIDFIGLSEIVEKILEVLQTGMTNDEFNHWKETPIDVRWNYELVHRWRQSGTMATVNTLINKMYLLMFLDEIRLDVDTERPPKRSKQPTLLDLSIAVQDGSVNAVSLSHPGLVQNLLHFLQLLDTELRRVVESRQELSDTEVSMLMTSLCWRHRFLHVCRLPLTQYGGIQGLLPVLVLHWTWLVRETIRTFVSDSSSLEFASALRQMEEVLGHDDSATKSSNHFRELHGHPKPHTTQETYHHHQQMIELCERVQDESLLIHTSSAEISSIRGRVVALFYKQESDDFPVLVTQTNEEVDDLLTSVPRDRKCHVALLPVLRTIGHVAESRLLGMTSSVLDVTSYVEFTTNIDLGPLKKVQMWNEINEETRWSKFPSLFVNHVVSLWNSDPGDVIQHDHEVVSSPLHYPYLSCHVSHLVDCSDITTPDSDDATPRDGRKHVSDHVVSHVTLAGVEAKVEQLHLLGEVLWRNSEHLCDLDSRSTEVKVLRAIVQRSVPTLTQLSKTHTITTLCPLELQQAIHDDLSTLERCDVTHTDRETDNVLTLGDLGRMWVRVGLVGMCMLAPRGPMDPVERRRMKVSYMKEERSDVEMELESRRWVWQVWLGETLDNEMLSQLHPRIAAMVTRLQTLMTSLSERQSEEVYRPQPSQFASIVQHASHLASTTCSIQHVTNLITRLTEATVLQLCQVEDEVVSWQTTLRQAVQKLCHDYPLYGDLTMPFAAALCQISHGVSMVLTAAKRTTDVMTSQVQTTLEAVSRMPFHSDLIPDSLCIANVIMTSPMFSANQSRWKCALLFLRNHVTHVRVLEEKTLTSLQTIFEHVTQLWLQQEERRKLHEVEKEAFYKYKPRQHGTPLTEAETENEERCQQFPTFHQEFADITDTDDLNTDPVRESPQDGATEPVFVGTLSDLDLDVVTDVHRLLFCNMADCVWWRLNSRELGSHLDAVKPVLMMNKLARNCLQQSRVLDSSLERHLVCGHLITNHQLLLSIQQQVTSNDDVHDKPYDVYRDANVGDVMTCDKLLVELRGRVEVLLAEWPEHPTLQQLILLVDRIRSFPVTSPIMKFVTGLELILQKAQDWESVAARRVSLVTELQKVTCQVIAWRKMELKSWNSCLDTVAWTCRQAGSKWWFHLYQLLTSYVTGTDEWQEKGEERLVEALQQFVETSTVGEIGRRLELLLSFHCHIVQYRSSTRSVYAMYVLWNVHQFYTQFMPNVEKNHHKLRQPIEKQLKDFVKIAKWNDVNYWAMKQATDRTHRTLRKYIREYEDLLSKPAKEYFVEQTNSSTGHISALVTVDVEDFLITIKVPSNDVLHLADKVKIMKKLCRVVMETAIYQKAQVSLDSFTGEVIARVNELQSLDVQTTNDPEKRKSEIKHIHQRKRKALWDLFKYMTAMGVSYRKGMMSVLRIELEVMQQPCIDLCQLLGTFHKSSSDGSVMTAWPDYQTHYLRALSRHLLLTQALASPSPQLNTDILDRLRGFSRHLLDLSVRQRSKLTEFTEPLEKLKIAMEFLHQISSCRLSQLPRPSELTHVISSCRQVASQTTECLAQFKLLLEACPSGKDENLQASPFSELSLVARMRHGDENHVIMMGVVQRISTEATDLVSSLTSLRPSQYLSNHVVALIDECCKTFTDWLTGLRECIGLARGENSPIVQSLVFLQSRVKEVLSFFPLTTATPAAHDDVTISSHDFRQRSETLTLECLLVVQRFYKQVERKQHQKPESASGAGLEKEETEEEKEDDDDDEVNISEVFREWRKDSEMLNVTKITDGFTTLIDDVTLTLDRPSPAAILDEIQTFLRSATPVLDQYTRLVQYHVTCHVTLNRVVCKMVSVLQAIFADVAQKGFCLPPDVIEEGEGEGATKFQDIENGGLGQGEGSKDVSDQIETEDQLEDTHKKGEEQEKQDEADVEAEENAVEMSGDLDGKLQDFESKEADEEDRENEEEEEEEELEKTMGDVDDDQADKLDEQVWGDDDDGEQEENKEGKEETGPGDGARSESELVAKDDQEGHQEEKGQTKENQEEEPEKINEQKQIDQSEVDDDQVDPYYHDDRRDTQMTDDIDLPDDLDLDDEERGGEEEENRQEIDVDTAEPAEDDRELADVTMEEGEDDQKGEENQVDEDGEERQREDKEEVAADKIDEEDRKEEDMNQGEDNQEPNAGEAITEEEQKGDIEELGGDLDELTDDMTSENYVKKQHDVTDVQTVEAAQDQGGETEADKQEEGVGASETKGETSNQSRESSRLSCEISQQKEQRNARRDAPGQSENKRTLGSVDETRQKRLQTTDTEEQAQTQKNAEKQESDLYQHIEHGEKQFDEQTLDVASNEQLEKQETHQIQEDDRMEEEDHIGMHEDEDVADDPGLKDHLPAPVRQPSRQGADMGEAGEPDKSVETVTVEGELVETMTVHPGISSIHTVMDKIGEVQPIDVEKMRLELEKQLTVLPGGADITGEQRRAAEEAWQGYLSITSRLSHELCEQLRLVLEPTQASKLRGDYRTGKRLNMRKVIPYIASQFRKDKIWLRRTKPSKRTYQILLAVDDSSSMVDNHSKQLAFESLCLVSNALTLLEAGELAIASFGETVELLHSFGDPFTSLSGASLLTQFTFKQKKTKIAQLLDHTTSLMMNARRRQRSSTELSQLLLIVSDGRGLFLEGAETVQKAVRRARAANIFTAFVVIDNPANKDSILDIKVPVFGSGGSFPEIKSYMEQFPFPFYVILRDIESLPHILGDALRQWFELVTSRDR